MRDLFSLSYRIPAGYTGQHFPHGERTFHARRSIPSGPDTLLAIASLLSLRTSDRRHWFGDPSASLASLSEGGGIRRSPARRMTEGVVPRFAAGTSIDDGGSRSPLRRRHEHRSSAPALLSLRTSDRCHWCGNPSASPCRSHARQQTEGLSRPPLCHGFAQATPKSKDL